MRSDIPNCDEILDLATESFVMLNESLNKSEGMQVDVGMGLLIGLMRVERALLLKIMADLQQGGR